MAIGIIIAADLGYIRYKKYLEYKKQKREREEKVGGGLSGLMQLAVAAAQVELIEQEQNKPKFGPVTDPDLLLQLKHYYQHVTSGSDYRLRNTSIKSLAFFINLRML